MKNIIPKLVLLIICTLLYSCSVGLQGGARVFIEKDPEGNKVYYCHYVYPRMVEIIPPKPWPIYDPSMKNPYNTLKLEPSIIVKPDSIECELYLFYQDESNPSNFLIIPQNSKSLFITIDTKKEYSFSTCRGPWQQIVDLSKTPARVRLKVLREEAYYKISLEIFKEIASANLVQIKIKGNQNILRAIFDYDTLSSYKDFYKRYITEL